MRRRKPKQIRQEAIDLLLREEYNITQFMRNLNTNHSIARRVLDQLIDEEIVQVREKESSYFGRVTKHYRIPYDARFKR